MEKFITINNNKIAFTNEKNLLEIIRAQNIDVPTFCYHPELSVFGACRLCVVEIEGRGILSSCSTPPENGMVVQTSTHDIRVLRKVIMELMLANHNRDCTTCPRSESCQLQSIARQLGVKKVRYKNILKAEPLDMSTSAVVRDQSKCVLCGNCIRMCGDVQSVGAIDFAGRGSKTVVCPSFNKELEYSECVYCGQCARVCPTGAITPKTNVSDVWEALQDKTKTVVVAVAPAVRAAIGELFSTEPIDGETAAGKIVAALRKMGFAKVYDISFTADMTIVEEANEFFERIKAGKNLPLFTSCCPAWVKFVEKFYPEMTENISTAKSPQAMYGSIAKNILPKELGIKAEDIITVSIMPCTAKKYEATRAELAGKTSPDIDFVITTQELGRMIEETGINFNELETAAFDMPMGEKTGAGLIFGNSGGVMEAVLRNAVSLDKGADVTEAFTFTHGENGIKEGSATIDGKEVKVVVVQSLANARRVVEDIKNKKSKYDFIEVMDCPGGCVGGGGQPVCAAAEDISVRKARAAALYANDKALKFHRPKDNPGVQEMYKKHLGTPGEGKAHDILHVHCCSKDKKSAKPK